MSNIVMKLIIMLALPVAAFLAGSWMMSKMCDRHYVIQRISSLPDIKDRKPLNQRFAGYDVDAVSRYWAAFDETAFRSEQCFLKLDLGFPFLYGGALLISLLMAWTMLGKPFHPAWLMAPVVITILADWTENLVQLVQLRAYLESGAAGLHVFWIQIASMATVLKLTFFVGTVLFLLGLISAVIIDALKLR